MSNSGFICIVQISRMGDVLQMIKAIQAIGEAFPKNKSIYIGRTIFSAPFLFLLKKYFTKIYLFDDKFLLEAPPDNTPSMKESLKKVKNFINEINNNKITTCINITFSKSSSFLTGLIKSEKKMGLYRDKSYSLKVEDLWGQYVFSTVMAGPYNPFNLVDIYIEMFREGLNIEKSTNYSSLLSQKEQKIKNIHPKLVIHPFASQRKKKWNMKNWVKIIKEIINHLPNIEIIIIGNGQDMNDNQNYLHELEHDHYCKNILILVGKTKIKELFEIISSADLFLGHDSMGGHLASIQNIPVITVSLGTVRPSETTPYGENYNITPLTECYPCFPDEKCSHFNCHSLAPYQTIPYITKQILNGDEISRETLESFSEDLQIYQGHLQEGSFQSLHPILSKIPHLNEIFKNYYNIIWRFLLNEEEFSQDLPIINDQIYKILKNSLKGIDYLHSLCQFGMQYAYNIIDEYNQNSDQNMNKIKRIREHSNKLNEVEQMSFALKKTYPYLSPVIDFYYVSRANISGNNMLMIASNQAHSFKEEDCALKILQDFITKTINHYNKEKKLFSNSSVNPSPDN